MNSAFCCNNKDIEKGTFILAAYDEVFVNRLNPQFSQNRLYFAAGYALSSSASIQAGYLFQMFTGRVAERLQIALFFNPDLRKKD